jgi:hypothetical protein
MQENNNEISALDANSLSQSSNKKGVGYFIILKANNSED